MIRISVKIGSVFSSEKYTYNHILRTWRSAVQYIATLIIFITAPLALLFSIEVIMRRIAENSKGSIIALVGLLTAIAALLKAFS